MTSTEQMKKFKVKMNFTRIYDAVKPYKLRQYKPIPVMDEKGMKVFVSEFKVTGVDADDVCFTTMKDLVSLLRGQDVPEGIIMDVKNIASIKSIEELDE